MRYIETDTLTFAGLLTDPMIRTVMHSDGVSEEEYSSMLFRVRAALVARQTQSAPCHGRLTVVRREAVPA